MTGNFFGGNQFENVVGEYCKKHNTSLTLPLLFKEVPVPTQEIRHGFAPGFCKLQRKVNSIRS
jgi:hypothetical protein